MSTMTICDVRVQQHRDVTVYIFTLTAQQLLQLGRIERFGEVESGVQRPVKDSHVLDIAEAMCDPELIWLEPVAAALEGKWEFYEAEGELRVKRFNAERDYLSIDDGQHRMLALESDVLNEEELSGVRFEVKAYQGLSFERRLKLFRMQQGRTRIQRNLDLAQRARLGQWKHPIDKEAYEIVRFLAEEPRSPLVGRIQVTAGAREKYEIDESRSMHKLPAAGLHGAIRSALQRRSRLNTLPAPQRRDAIITLIRAAQQLWEKHWDNPDSNLTTSGGMKALLALFVSGMYFREQVGGNYTAENIERALGYASTFRWSKASTRNRTPRDLSNALDETIRRGVEREAREQRSENGNTNEKE